MRKADKIKLSIIVGVSLFAFVVGVVGCVDTSVQALPSTVNYSSEVNFVNLSTGLGTATFSTYGSVVDQDSLAAGILATKYDWSSPVSALSGAPTLGSMLPANGSYLTEPAGKKAIVVTYSTGAQDTFKVSFDSNWKMRFFLLGDSSSASSRILMKSSERYIWQTPGSTDGAGIFPSGEAAFRYVNGCPDASFIQVQIYAAANDSLIDFANADYEESLAYYQLAAGNYYFLIVGDNNVYDSVAVSMGSMKRYTIISYGYNANLQSKVLTDD
jgi:hypothetical protein